MWKQPRHIIKGPTFDNPPILGLDRKMIHIISKWDLQKERKFTSHLQRWCHKSRKYLRFLLDSNASSWTSLWYHQKFQNWHQYYAEYLDVKNLPFEHKNWGLAIQGPNHTKTFKPTCRIAQKEKRRTETLVPSKHETWQFSKLHVLFFYFCTNIYLVIMPPKFPYSVCCVVELHQMLFILTITYKSMQWMQWTIICCFHEAVCLWLINRRMESS